jgi:anti-sigma B factor antagonist
MRHEIREEAGTAVVAFEGEIDLESSPRAREALLAAVKRGAVLVDLAGVAYMDSSGVASLVEAYQLARRNGTRFGIFGLRDAPRRVLELARLDRVFPIFATLEEARGEGPGGGS